MPRQARQDLQLTVNADASGIEHLMSQARAKLLSWPVPAAIVHEILIITDELASNIVRHAWHDGMQHLFTYGLSLQPFRTGSEISVLLRDNGAPFDPTQHTPTELDKAMDQRMPGGNGLALVQSLADEMQYSGLNGENHVRAAKSFL
jgi:anti-sigma regulatory factor (Ser/Thr protein kinase)